MINCIHCGIEFHRKPSEIKNINFCTSTCFYSYKKLQDLDDKLLNKFIKTRWTSMNLRAGKYRQNTNKNKVYKNIHIEMTRDEFALWCGTQIKLIKSMNIPTIDRIDSNKNYTLDNIRILELKENCQNKRAGNRFLNGEESNKIRGIRKRGNQWQARISIKSKETHLGQFDTKELAIEAFRKAYFDNYGRYPY